MGKEGNLVLGPTTEAGLLVVAALALVAWRRPAEMEQPHDSRERGWCLAGAAVLLAGAALLRLFQLVPTQLDLPFQVAWTEDALLLAAAALLLPPALARRRRTPDLSDLLGHCTLDPLTQTASHRAFQDRLLHECERAYRFGDTFALLLIDLDQFQLVNNRYGHKTGDRILVELAARLRPLVREIDLCARFGGDQFAFILPHTLERGGAQTAERLRKSIAAWSFLTPHGSEIRLTASVALALYPQDADTSPELVAAAKQCVAFAKSLGGNQLQLYRELPAQPLRANGPQEQAGEVGRGTIVRSLAAAVDIRDRYTHSHSHLVSELSAATARSLGLHRREVGRIRIGALLHDVGKIGIPDAILSKEGTLTSEEWGIIREHPVLGKTIVEQSPELADVVPMVLHHQERYDGTGYPTHISGETIPLGARIIAAADAYHAIRSDRPYRSGRTHEEAVAELRRCASSQFDPRVVSALIQSVESDPGLQGMVELRSNPTVEASSLQPRGAMVHALDTGRLRHAGR